MARILAIVEGQTEETFTNTILAPHLREYGHYISATILGNARSRNKRGGIRGWDASRSDIVRHLQGDRNVYVTTMVDYYGLPATPPHGWPGRQLATAMPFHQKASTVTGAMLQDIIGHLGTGYYPARFVPFVMMHEFEALLFSDCQGLSEGIGRPDLAVAFSAVVSSCGGPEEINDSPLTAPSKRIEQLFPRYQKPIMGALAARRIGLDRMRAECPTFDDWVTTLERLP